MPYTPTTILLHSRPWGVEKTSVLRQVLVLLRCEKCVISQSQKYSTSVHQHREVLKARTNLAPPQPIPKTLSKKTPPVKFLMIRTTESHFIRQSNWSLTFCIYVLRHQSRLWYFDASDEEIQIEEQTLKSDYLRLLWINESMPLA